MKDHICNIILSAILVTLIFALLIVANIESSLVEVRMQLATITGILEAN